MAPRKHPAPKPAGRYHHGALRRALLDAALRLVEEQGVEALSLRELARRLGVSHAAPGHHFPDRLALLVALSAEGFERLAGDMEAAAEGRPPGAERLAAVGEAYLRFALDHPAHLQIMFGPEVGGMRIRPPELRAPSERARGVLDETIAQLAGVPPRGPGAPRDPIVEVHTFAAWALLHGAARLWIDGPLRASMERRGAGRARFEELARGAIAIGTDAVARSAARRGATNSHDP
ncbi:MAG TPA: TetR/AcrR family transcriptional regulator [Anaeromyxobacter sp.]|nr:TetR/AcrR family transcriptional regulator [Anaeromyxobacter sp.]